MAGEVPIDYSALLCRRPDYGSEMPEQPKPLDFLKRILRENDVQANKPRRESVIDSSDDRDDRDTPLSGSTSALDDQDDAELIPPDNFAMVNSWIYRSSFPKKKHFPFLKTLGLRSVLCVTSARILTQYVNS